VFDEHHLSGNTAAARAGAGAMLIRASAPLTLLADGPTSGCELRLPGRHGWWLLRLGQAGRLDDFTARFAGLTLTGTGPREVLQVDDPEYGRVVFTLDGRVQAQGRTLSPAHWTVQGQRQDWPNHR
jgi:hypothetical protein